MVVSVRSLVWPGMVYVNKDNQTCSLYVGDGMKYSPNDHYFPKFPYLIMSEPSDKQEQQDPIGSEQ